MLVDRVINCTGPDYNIRRSQRSIDALAVVAGLAVADPLNLGLRTGAYGALINAQGQRSAQPVLRRPDAAGRSLGSNRRAGAARLR